MRGRVALSALLGGYAAAMTAAAGWLALRTVQPTTAKVLDVERINVREPDGTLRLAIASHARMPGLIVAGREWPHPNRPGAGLIFYNGEGTENGGLVSTDAGPAGRPTAAVSPSTAGGRTRRCSSSRPRTLVTGAPR